MLKNNKGYMLAETIIALTIVATVITVIYASTMNYYINQNNNLKKYNTTDGLFVAKEIKKYYLKDVNNFKDELNSKDYLDITNSSTINDTLDIKKIYFSRYTMTNTLLNDKGIPLPLRKELTRLNTVDQDKCEYRYLIIFKDNSYSTIGVNCND